MKWVKRWCMWIAPEPAIPGVPGVWRHKDGGVLVRGHAKDPRSGRLVEIKKYLPDATPREGVAWLEAERDKVRRDLRGPARSKTVFRVYATQLFERKVASGDIVSAAGITKWKYALEHILAAPWAGFFVDKVRHADVSEWRDTLPSLTYERVVRRRTAIVPGGGKKSRRKTRIERVVVTKRYSARTINTWLDVLSTISAKMTREFELHPDPCAGIERFTVDPPYPPEAPNALSPEKSQIGVFLAGVKRRYPQHYAIAFLGFAIGHRPSTLRPLRRKGPTPDIVFNDDDSAQLFVRRSHTEGQAVMERTKTGAVIVLDLPRPVGKVLKAHIKQLDADPVTRNSDLLFPSTRTGGLQSKTGLAKAFEAVRLELGLPKLTPKAMRRTWKDVARSAGIEAAVRKAVTGHATDAMEVHYSTAQPGEKRSAVKQVVRINTKKPRTRRPVVRMVVRRDGQRPRKLRKEARRARRVNP